METPSKDEFYQALRSAWKDISGQLGGMPGWPTLPGHHLPFSTPGGLPPPHAFPPPIAPSQPPFRQPGPGGLRPFPLNDPHLLSSSSLLWGGLGSGPPPIGPPPPALRDPCSPSSSPSSSGGGSSRTTQQSFPSPPSKLVRDGGSDAGGRGGIIFGSTPSSLPTGHYSLATGHGW